MVDLASARRMHVALTALYIFAVVLIEIGLFLRAVHLASLLLLDTGFTFAVMAGLLVTLVHGFRHASVVPDGSFYVGDMEARIILWLCVVALAFIFFNAVRIIIVLSGPGDGITPELFSNVSHLHPIGQAGLEALLRHHLHEEEWFVLLVIFVFYVLLVILHIVTIVYCARVSYPQFWLARGATIRPYNAANNNNTGN